MSKFRCSNVKFLIETGRWANIPQHERICRFCQGHIGNEFHFLFVCKHPQIIALRHKYAPRYYTLNPPENKMLHMLSYCYVMLYRNLCYVIKNIMRVLDVM